MLRLANRTARAATAGLLGLLVAAPPPSWADDREESKRSRGHVARSHHADRDHTDRGRHRDDRNDRRRHDAGRNHRREHVQKPAPRVHHEHRRPPPQRVARHDHDRHEARRDRAEWRDDRREWLRERQRRERWREHHERHEHDWRHARYAVDHARHWHWHGDRWCPPGHRTPPGRRVGWYRNHRDDWRWARYRRPVIVHSGFYCAPCAHWYQDRHGFDRHVYGYHRLPQLAFRDAVAEMVWGLVYFGL